MKLGYEMGEILLGFGQIMLRRLEYHGFMSEKIQ